MYDPEIKAIETNYHGYNMRSRLEARYAVFFDILNIPWEYEKEGYDLGKLGRYLPDFWLPATDEKATGINCPVCTGGYWFEVKGVEPTQLEIERLAAVADMTHTMGYISFGLPADNNLYATLSVDCGSLEIHRWQVDRDSFIDLSPEEQIVRELWPFARYNIILPSFVSYAAAKAKSARFEHGESGAR